MSEKLHVDLSGAPQTMLATFYAKALDADLPKPILGDRWAKEIVDRIDYDWSKTSITKANSPSVTTRSAHFDNWARQFLAVHAEATVVHLGCGLDARAFRLDPGPGVEWYDVDYPDVIDLRRQLFPSRDNYHVIAASVTDPAWLADVRSDRPTLMIAEGLTMYLTQSDGVALLRRFVDTFPSGELQFDAFNRPGHQVAVDERCGAPVRGHAVLGGSTDPTTSSRRCREFACWPGSPLRLRDASQTCLVLPRDGRR